MTIYYFRLNQHMKRRVMTPVRRSVRLQNVNRLPQYLKESNERIVTSPGMVEDAIIDGELSFMPNSTIDTPLNKGWIINKNIENSKEVEKEIPEKLEMSFM